MDWSGTIKRDGVTYAIVNWDYDTSGSFVSKVSDSDRGIVGAGRRTRGLINEMMSRTISV